MKPLDPEWTDRCDTLHGRGSRRRFLASMVAAGLTAPVANARGATLTITAPHQGGAIMARQTDEAVETDELTVPGARLYYEVSGSGPVLLLIPGGPADAGIFALIVAPLAEHYTVVRYDPRGFSRSRLDGPAADVPVAVHADDAHRLLLALGGEPASVFGSSGGAVIGLALAERHPEQVQTLVAHEPPLLAFLPEGSARRRASQEIYDTYLKEGAGPAFQTFAAVAGLGEPELPSEMTPEVQEAMARIEQNTEFFFRHYLLPITANVPDVATLQEGASRIVVGVGEASGGQLAHESALGLAERLETEAVTFPGGHAGDLSHPDAFAAKLHEVFQSG